jgi:hypothetical protein
MVRAVALVLCFAALLLAVNTVVIPPVAKVEYIAYSTEEMTVKIPGVGSGANFASLTKPYLTPGEEYAYTGMKIEFLGAYPSIKAGADGRISMTLDESGLPSIIYAGPDVSRVTLVNTAKSAVDVRLRVTYMYAKAEYVPLNASTTITVSVTKAAAQKFREMVRITIEPYLPYVIKSVESLSGESQLAYRVEPKLVEITEQGSYRIEISRGPELPAVMLVKSLSKQTAVIGAGEELQVTGGNVEVPSGWNLLGYVVIAYAADVTLIGRTLSGDVRVEGDLVDITKSATENIVIRTASYLIPPVWQFTLFYKIAIVYGGWFKVASSMQSPINVIYIPIVYRGARVRWLPDRALVNVTNEDVAEGAWTAITVQLPELARIVAIRTPGNALIANATDMRLAWQGGSRAASISPDGRQAYIVAHMGEAREAGIYTFLIEWRPLRIPVLDNKGRPVGSLSANCTKFEAVASAGYVEVRLFKPEPFDVEIYYRGVPAARVEVNSLIERVPPVTLNLYTVRVIVVGALNQPIKGAAVALAGFPAAGRTDDAGSVVFADVLSGTYRMHVSVGDRVKVSEVINVNGDLERVVKTPVLAFVWGVPITTFDALAAAGGASLLGLYLALRRRESPVAEVEQV